MTDERRRAAERGDDPELLALELRRTMAPEAVTRLIEALSAGESLLEVTARALQNGGKFDASVYGAVDGDLLYVRENAEPFRPLFFNREGDGIPVGIVLGLSRPSEGLYSVMGVPGIEAAMRKRTEASVKRLGESGNTPPPPHRWS